MKIPFFVVTGFLGSGKTTLLRRFLEKHADTRRIAVVQNEFAPGSIDGADLRRTGKRFETVEISNGSVFCTCLLSDFEAALVDLIDTTRPDAVVLETSGLADPIALAQVLAAPELRDRLYLAHSWCVVDGATFLLMEKALARIGNQVRIADHVVINKKDLTDRAMIGLVEKRVRELNQLALVSSTTHCGVPLASAFAVVKDPVAIARAEENGATAPGGRPVVESTAVRSTVRVDRLALQSFLDTFAPRAYRIKGLVNLTDGSVVMVQSTFGLCQTETVEGYAGPTEILAMGPALDIDAFEGTFEDLTAE